MISLKELCKSVKTSGCEVYLELNIQAACLGSTISKAGLNLATMTAELNYSLASPTPFDQPVAVVARVDEDSSNESFSGMHADLVNFIIDYEASRSESSLVQLSSAEARLPFQMHAAILAAFQASGSATPSSLLRHFQPPLKTATLPQSSLTAPFSSLSTHLLATALFGQATRRLSDPKIAGGEGLAGNASLSLSTGVETSRSTEKTQIFSLPKPTVVVDANRDDAILVEWPLPILSPETLAAAASWRAQYLKALGHELGSSLDDFWTRALISFASGSKADNDSVGGSSQGGTATCVPTFRELTLPLWASVLGTPPHLLLALLAPPQALLALQSQRISAIASANAASNSTKGGGNKSSKESAVGTPSTLARSPSLQEREGRWEEVSTRLQNLQV